MKVQEACRLQELLHEGPHSLIYRGVQGERAVICKLPRRDPPTARELSRLQGELKALRRVDSPYVIRALGVESHQRTAMLVLEDCEGTSLDRILRREPRRYAEPQQFLDLAVEVCQGLEALHSAGLTHQRLNPSNILVASPTRIIDLALPGELEGHLPYVSPEQTGRTSASVDCRTDFYSLGVVFYELLMGHRPFRSEDPLELLACHLAVEPAPLTGVPPILAEIVLRLLSKTPEARYQSAWGLRADLQRCRDEGWRQTFVLGRQDVADALRVSQKLYGREEQLRALQQAVQRIEQTGDREFILVAGYSGVGKTSLVRSLHADVAARGGQLVAGKYEQFRRNIPYSGLVQAFAGLILGWLTQTEAALQQRRERLQAALGAHLRIIVEAIPELELILGRGPELSEVEALESQHRFDRTWLKFIASCCAPGQPLVVFLDDLQWADLASLRLLELIMTDPQVGPFLLVGAYRDNEVDAEHPLTLTVQALPGVTRIQVQDLRLASIVELLADTLRCEPETVRPLAGLIERKTHGNPLFINEFLRNLHAEGLVAFDPRKPGWAWDFKQIQGRDFTDNVADLMGESVRKLPSESQRALGVAACVGVQFAPALLEKLLGTDVDAALALPVAWGMVRPVSELEYRFSHDKVQQAALGLLGEEEARRMRLAIGRQLLQDTPASHLGEQIFSIVDHLQQAVDLVENSMERRQVAHLSLLAGTQARRGNANKSALAYLSVGVSLAPDDWELLRELAEVEFLLGHLDRCEEIAFATLARLDQVSARIGFYQLLVRRFSLASEYDRAIEIASTALQLLGVELPREQAAAAAEEQLASVRARLADRPAGFILELPEMEAPEHRLTVQLLDLLIPPTFQSGRMELFTWVYLKAVDLCLQHGNCPAAPFCYSWYGNLLNFRFGEYAAAYQMGLDALHLAQRQRQSSQECKVFLTLGAAHAPWVEPIEAANQYLDRCFAVGLECGELQFAGFAWKHRFFHLVYRGARVDEIVAFHGEVLPFLQATRNQLALDVARTTMLLVELLSDQPRLVEAEVLADCERHESAMALCCYCIARAQVHYCLEEYAGARDCLARASELLPTIICFVARITHSFVSALLALHDGDLEAAATHQARLPGHKHQLIEAELAHRRGDRLAALEGYEAALRGAREAGFLQDEALGYELAARFYAHWGQEVVARAYIQEAYHAYERWGARARLRQLEKLHPDLQRQQPTEAALNLDLDTMVRASRVLSSESRLSVLLEGTLELAHANAGAQRGWLLLREGEDWVRAASARAGEPSDSEREKLDLDDPAYPGALLRYTARTREALVLEDARLAGPFRADPYVVGNAVRSVLCLPLEYGQRLVGLLYLENNLAPGTFTRQHVDVLRTLASQMAISLDILHEREARHDQELRSQGLEARKDALAAVLGIASHDLKSPLAAITMWARSLEDPRARDNILQACRRAGSLIRTYLDVVAVETGGQLKLNRRPVDLTDLVEQEIEFQLQALAPAERSQTQLGWDLEPLEVEVDPERLQQVVGNLVGNALKYCPLGTSIEVTLRRQHGLVRLSVRDEGPGIDAERQVGLFQPFERRTRELAGSGLGLWICRVIAESHGGRMGVESQPGRGSHFYCEVPVIPFP